MQEQPIKQAKKRHSSHGAKALKDLDVRDLKTIQGVLAGKAWQPAMIEAGWSRTYAAHRTRKKRMQLMPTIQAIMDRRGLNEKGLVKTLCEGINADKVVAIMKNDGVVEKIKAEDYPTRHKYLETALKLKGHMNNNSDQTQQVIIINAEKFHDIE